MAKKQQYYCLDCKNRISKERHFSYNGVCVFCSKKRAEQDRAMSESKTSKTGKGQKYRYYESLDVSPKLVGPSKIGKKSGDGRYHSKTRQNEGKRHLDTGVLDYNCPQTRALLAKWLKKSKR